MGSGSSTKKIARVAAASGAKRQRKQRNLGFSAGLVAIVIVGLLLVVFARNANQSASANDTPPKANLGDGKAGDHWHDAFAVDICSQERPPVQDTSQDKLGIESHGDGVIHIHPFATRAAGKGATLGKFFDQVGLKVTDTEIRTPDGKIYREGETSCGGKPGEVVLAHWKNGRKATGKKPDKIITSGIGKVDLTENYGAYTLGFRAKGASVPAPSSAADLEQLGQADAAPTGAQQVPGQGGSGGQPVVPGGATGQPVVPGGATGQPGQP